MATRRSARAGRRQLLAEKTFTFIGCVMITETEDEIVGNRLQVTVCKDGRHHEHISCSEYYYTNIGLGAGCGWSVVLTYDGGQNHQPEDKRGEYHYQQIQVLKWRVNLLTTLDIRTGL